MALNITTDYAVRILLHLAMHPIEDGSSISGKEISEEMKIPYNYFLKIVPKLKDAGLIVSYQGKHGGYALDKNTDDITVYDIIHAMDDDLILNQCLADPSACSRNATGFCAVHAFFDNIQEKLDHDLKGVTLDQVVADQQKRNILHGQKKSL